MNITQGEDDSPAPDLDLSQGDNSDEETVSINTFYADSLVEQTEVGAHSVRAPLPPISLRTIPLEMVNPVTGAAVRANALLDDGSDSTVLSTDLAAELGLVPIVARNKKFRVTGFSGAHTEHAHLTTSLSLRSVSKVAPCVVEWEQFCYDDSG